MDKNAIHQGLGRVWGVLHTAQNHWIPIPESEAAQLYWADRYAPEDIHIPENFLS